jgi:hypothetical protein
MENLRTGVKKEPSMASFFAHFALAPADLGLYYAQAGACVTQSKAQTAIPKQSRLYNA